MNKYKGIFIIAALLLAGRAGAQDDQRSRVQELQAAIDKAGANWKAGDTGAAGDRANWPYYVGFDFEPVQAPPAELGAEAPPPALDWRDRGGNFVTPARDQLKCGSCWAFAMTGGLESYSLLRQGTPGRDLDLSEQVMVSCSGAGSCKGGKLKAGFLQTTGLPEESAYPYTATDGSCSAAAPGWQGGALRIGGWGSVRQDVEAMKAALFKYGPIPTAMMVYEDFMNYKSGVYGYVSGKRLGGHAVLLVGYDDADQYFIVKNSWNTAWGENGFFRIGYSELRTVVSFGLSTIAYKQAGELKPAGEAAGDSAAKRAAPLFEGAAAWK